MPRYRTAYPPEFRRQMVDLVRSGRTPEELAREFEPTGIFPIAATKADRGHRVGPVPENSITPIQNLAGA